jgi:L-fucose mutarotase
MLMEISNLITPEIYDVIYRMGHLDELVLADANYRASAMSPKVVYSSVKNVDLLLLEILKYFPIDEDEENAVTVMIPDHGYDHEPEIWKDYKVVLEKNGYTDNVQFYRVQRLEFYQRTKNAYATIQTNDIRLFADIIIRKGFVVE